MLSVMCPCWGNSCEHGHVHFPHQEPQKFQWFPMSTDEEIALMERWMFTALLATGRLRETSWLTSILWLYDSAPPDEVAPLNTCTLPIRQEGTWYSEQIRMNKQQYRWRRKHGLSKPVPICISEEYHSWAPDNFLSLPSPYLEDCYIPMTISLWSGSHFQWLFL